MGDLQHQEIIVELSAEMAEEYMVKSTATMVTLFRMMAALKLAQ
jgi:hypothetical protein